jgi:cobyrinic acid a,c-diamide synthase
MPERPRVMIAAPASGSGKTTAVCGILQALVDRGLKVSSFKCGPDYIDPMFHARVIGTKSRNLDSFFTPPETLKYLMVRGSEGTDISVVEAVMGFYDGRSTDSEIGSSYEISEITETPVILLVNCRGAALSIAATVKGFKDFRPNRIAGCILNNISPSTYADVKGAVEKETGVEVVGYIPRLKDMVLESRHLGLVLPDEVAELKKNLKKLAGILEDSIDIDRIIAIAKSAPPIEGKAPSHSKLDSPVKIGFAYDDAFCFTYEDNIELLKECGAEIVPFSPMKDQKLPEGIHGIVLSGGYPELHGAELSGNASMLQDIREKAAAGMPILAECGGFMYLHEKMEDADGKVWPMVGIIKGEVRNTGHLTRFGYVSLSSEDPESIIAGGAKGHEFHYWDSSDCGDSWKGVKTSGKVYGCGHEEGNLCAGFPHLYYYSNPEVPYRFLRKCAAWKP